MALERGGPAAGIVHTFAGGDLDRSAHLRSDDERVMALRRSAEARHLPFRGLDPLVAEKNGPALAWLTGDEIRALTGEDPVDEVFLGMDGSSPRFAFAVPDDFVDDAGALDGTRFRGAREIASYLTGPEAAVVAMGRSLIGWNATNGYCARCGGPSTSTAAGHARRCSDPECGELRFPRVDPVVIMLLYRGESCLLARAVRTRRYPPGLYSCLAGYVEPGESIEEAVRRETREESGLRVRRVRYHSSQPWPFPSTLMIGCFAEVLPGEVRLDPEELEDARWFTRDEIGQAVARWREEGALRLPPPLTIAHQLAAAWLAEGGRS